MLETVKNFFRATEPTLEDAHKRAEQLGWRLEEVDGGYVLHGIDAYDQPKSWQYDHDELFEIHCLFDYVLSKQGGIQKVKEYHSQFKPGWRRILNI